MKLEKSGSHSFRFKIALIKATNRTAIISLTQKKKFTTIFVKRSRGKQKL